MNSLSLTYSLSTKHINIRLLNIATSSQSAPHQILLATDWVGHILAMSRFRAIFRPILRPDPGWVAANGPLLWLPRTLTSPEQVAAVASMEHARDRAGTIIKGGVRMNAFDVGIFMSTIIMLLALLTSGAQAQTCILPGSSTNCDSADLLICAGMTAEAEKEIQKLIETPENHNCVESSIRLLSDKKALEKKEAQNTGFDHVRALANLGFYDEALTQLKAVLKENKAVKTPADLEYLSGYSWDVWRQARRWFHKNSLVIIEVIATIGFLYLILHLLWRWLFAKPLLRIEDFVAVDPTKNFSKNVTAMLQACYQRFGEGHSEKVTRISVNFEGLSLPGQLQAALPSGLQNQFLMAIPLLIEKFLPRRLFLVTGHLLESETKGAGLALLVTNNKQHSASVTLWESEYRKDFKPREEIDKRKNTDQSGDFEELVEYGAIWLLYTLADLYGSRLGRYQRFRAIRRRMGTDTWQAYALFRAANHAQEQGLTDAARELYVRAIRCDPGLNITKYNLAWLCHKDNSDLAQELWEQTINNIDNKQKEKEEKDTLGNRRKRRLRQLIPKKPISLNKYAYFGSIYALAGLALNDRTDPEQMEKGLQLIDRLLDDLKPYLHRPRYLTWLCWIEVTRWGSRENMQVNLTRLEQLAKICQAGFLAADATANHTEEKVRDAEKLVNEVEKDRTPMPGVNYDLACAHSLLAEYYDKKDPSLRDKNLDLSLQYLRWALWMDPYYDEDIETDNTLDYVWLERENDINELLRKPPPEPASAYALADYQRIGRYYAERLAEEGVMTGFEFLRLAKTPSQRKALADKLEIGCEQVDQWAFSIELSEIPGIEIKHLDLLTAAGIWRVSDLRKENEDSLLLKLMDWGKTLGIDELPDRSDVVLWIKAAKNQPKLVFD